MRRRALIATAVALAGAVAVVLVADPFARHGADRVKHLVDWDESCVSIDVVRKPVNWSGFFAYARRWTSAEERASIGCLHAGDAVGYARFPNETALRHDLAVFPPIYRSCGFRRPVKGITSVEDSEKDGRWFRRMCARRKGLLYEREFRYCVAGTEVVVDDLDDPHVFDKACDELGGHTKRPASVPG